MDAPCTVREVPIVTAVTTESESASLVESVEHAVVVEAEPDVMLVTAGEQGPPGIGAFDEWLKRNPGGTWEQFMTVISGDGAAVWLTTEW
ncbi:hypothetical protein SAMN05216421_1119 [Halopseudomonas xinjiangensis]|uniref:Uncharacterized protein n=1 Tax=Halopseudomonas xinjiangensis TaxID=487184 RepID=A0A1H1QG55_9GAMM|nr:hypothetical protein [Halopseudomonas xinjiangensis]SDS21849.1 hypothetical protein SAMN05216421_1119 [Halopseudomonas xinjiangensis]